MSQRFKQDVERDAMIVRLRMIDPFLVGQRFDMKPDEVMAHAIWLSRQSKAYRDRVVAKVEEIMDHEN